MSPYSITRENAARDLEALRATIDGRHYPDESEAAQIAVLQELADSIEEQMRPEEPLAFASVVKVRSGTQFVRIGAAEAYPWVSGSCARTWNELDRPEVLRIGVGEAAYPHPDGDVIVLGPETFKAPDDSVISHKGENYYPTSVVITSSEERRSQRFCTVTQNCRLADGHADGCRP